MTIVNSVSFTNVVGGKGLLEKIKSTAVSWGWTAAMDEPGHWDPATDGWVADVNAGFLMLTSPGQGGSQNLIARLQFDWVDATPTRYAMCVAMSSSTTYTPTLVTAPVFQEAITTENTVSYMSYGWSLPTITIPQVWILGNSQYIFVCCNLDGVLHTMMEFGSYEMREAAPVNQNGSTARLVRITTVSASWDTYVNYTPQGYNYIYNIPSVSIYGSSNPDYPYWEDTELNSSAYWYHTVHKATPGANSIFCFTDDYINCLTTDNSGRRFMMRNTILYKRPLDGLIIPVSETYASLFNGIGLQPAQSLFYGSDEYIVFPCCSVLSPIWLAFRIA